MRCFIRAGSIFRGVLEIIPAHHSWFDANARDETQITLNAKPRAERPESCPDDTWVLFRRPAEMILFQFMLCQTSQNANLRVSLRN
jgi:hypothetical protein